MISALSLDSMSYTWFLVFSCSIFIAAIMGGVRFRKVDPAFHPFIFILWIGSLNEISSIYLVRLGHNTDLNNNIYVLLEAVFLLWQLKNWDGFNKERYFFPLLIIALSIGWLLENYFFSDIHTTLPWFRISYSFILVILSVQQVNKIIISERRSLIRNPIFLICMGFTIYFTYKVFVEICWINDGYSSPGLLINIYSIMIWINLITNIIYSFAVLWMPGKQRFTLPF